jgi:hypothetical protein
LNVGYQPRPVIRLRSRQFIKPNIRNIKQDCFLYSVLLSFPSSNLNRPLVKISFMNHVLNNTKKRRRRTQIIINDVSSRFFMDQNHIEKSLSGQIFFLKKG